MLDYRQRAIVYRHGVAGPSRHIATGADRLLQVIPIKPSQPILFSTDWGARGRPGRAAAGPLG